MMTQPQVAEKEEQASPRVAFSYQGTYRLTLARGANAEDVPEGAVITDREVFVLSGTINRAPVAPPRHRKPRPFRLTCTGAEFYLMPSHILRITDGFGTELWKNELSEENFENPTGRWSYEGAYSFTLTAGADTEKVPQAIVEFSGRSGTVTIGLIQKKRHGILLVATTTEFYYNCDDIFEIRDQDGYLIWRNPSTNV